MTGPATESPDMRRSPSKASGSAPPPKPPSAAEGVDGPGGGSLLLIASSFLSRQAVIAVLVVLVVTFTVWMPETFGTWGNFRVMMSSQTIVLVLAVAATFVLRSGEFDLSLGNVMALSAVALGVLTDRGVSMVPAVLVVLALGVLIGLINGFLVVKVGVNSLIATLGMLTVLAGVTFALTDGRRAATYPDALERLVYTEVLGLPALTFYGWILVVAVWYVYEKTPFGRMLLFVGGNPDAARLSGIRVDRLRMMAFVVASLLSTLAGIMIAGYLGSIDPAIGSAYLLAPFAAAFLGATTISPGRYNAFGTFFGLCLLTVGITGLQLLGGALWVSDVFNGLALIVAVTLGRLAGRAHA